MIMKTCQELPGRMREICEGTALIDGKTITEDVRRFYVEFWQQQGILKKWDVTMPCRGMGDVVAKITHATGIDKIVKWLHGSPQEETGSGCKPCGQRQDDLNAAIPFRN